MKKEKGPTLRDYQVEPVKETIESLLSGKKTVLVGSPSSGKTKMAIYILKELFDSGKIKRAWVIPHVTSVIKDNFLEALDEFDLDFRSKVVVELPQSSHKLIGQFDIVIADEAHESYLAAKVSGLTKSIPMHLLLTGTPSKLIKEGGYNLITIPMAEIPRKYFSKTGIELVTSKYNWSAKDYDRNRNLTSSFWFGKDATRDAVDQVISQLAYRLENTSLKPIEFNSSDVSLNTGIKVVKTGLKRIGAFIKAVNPKMSKSMWVCRRKEQAEWVNEKLRELGYESRVSHSSTPPEKDANGEIERDANGKEVTLFNKFKNGKFDSLVVVGQGRLGYSDDNLYNIIDLSGTMNPDLIYQMFSRCVRGTQDQQKFYIKVAPKGPGMLDMTAICTQMGMSLMFRDVIIKFNGSNFNTMKVFIKKQRQRSAPKGAKRKRNPTKIKYPEYTNDVIAQFIDVRHSLDSGCQIYKMVDIGDVISQVTGDKYHKGYWTEENIKRRVLELFNIHGVTGVTQWGQVCPSSEGASRKYPELREWIRDNVFVSDRKNYSQSDNVKEMLIDSIERAKRHLGKDDISPYEWEKFDGSAVVYAKTHKLHKEMTSTYLIRKVKETAKYYTMDDKDAFNEIKKEIISGEWIKKGRHAWRKTNQGGYGYSLKKGILDKLFS